MRGIGECPNFFKACSLGLYPILNRLERNTEVAEVARARESIGGRDFHLFEEGAAPVFDGMIAVSNRVVICHEDGTVECWSGKE